MGQSEEADAKKKKFYKVTTVPFPLTEKQENLTINTKTPSKPFQPSQEQIINQAIKFHLEGNIAEATKLYQYCINQGFNDHIVFSNYGVILKNLGRLQDSELSTRKAIEINPDYAEAHYNLGLILRDLGKLKEAELSTRKAIELKQNYAEAHSNLGNILRSLGRLQDAELSTRKAIKIKPDYAIAHSNLGSILSDLGNLQKAEISQRKAIELNPDFVEAHYNLGNILRDLGKLTELIILSESILESNSLNQGYKLLARLRITIANLLKGDFPKTFLNINKTKELINHKAIDTLKDEKNRKNSSNYFRFITSLYPLLEKKNYNPDLEKIPHIAESHCLSFAHQSLYISSKLKQIQPVLIMGGKAWHFANNKHNRWKDSLNQQIKKHTYSNQVLISFGEIDCRKDEGILSYSIKNDKNISEVCENTVKSYLDYMEKVLSQNYSRRYYFGIAAPTKTKELFDELDIKRIKIIKLYNSTLKREVLSKGCYFLDVYALTSTKDGTNNNLHMCDNTHLSPKCLSILFENYLYKT